MKKHEWINKPSTGDGMTEKINKAVTQKRNWENYVSQLREDQRLLQYTPAGIKKTYWTRIAADTWAEDIARQLKLVAESKALDAWKIAEQYIRRSTFPEIKDVS
jgi:hypothetical protein